MQRVCLVCTRAAPDNNLFCQEPYCPAERAPRLLEAGEWLGDIEVERPLSTLRTSALYAARQAGRPVLLKVAHPSQVAVDRLKREVALLHKLAAHGAGRVGLPVLLPPYLGSNLNTNPYGRAVLQGQLLYFCLFSPFDGGPLPDLLAERPQLWVYQVGWLLGSIARAVALLQSRELVHYSLCPEAILVRFDEANGTPRILLADLGLAAARPALAAVWDQDLLPPSYSAPELIDSQAPPASFAIDVYGLGLLLHELLTGVRAYPHRLGGDGEIRREVGRARPLHTGRAEDVRDLALLAEQATSPDQAARPRNAADFATRLRAAIGEAPLERRPWLPDQRPLLIALVVLVALVFVTATAIGIFLALQGDHGQTAQSFAFAARA